MPEVTEFVLTTDLKEWDRWLKKNHLRKDKIFLMKYKKHTGKETFSHADAMKVAISYGWIDTTVKKIDEDKYGHFFAKRTKNSGWSKNTLRYAKELIDQKKMSPFGKEMYDLGRKKKPIDHGVSKNPPVPEELKKALLRNKKAKTFFDGLAPSYKRVYILIVVRAKRPETKKKWVKFVVDRCAQGKKYGE